MLYEIGDYVYPSDLPRPVKCRVEEVERRALAGGEVIQILTLAPLDGPWRPGTLLVRLDGAVRPAKGSRGRPTRMAVRRAAVSARSALSGAVAIRTAKVIRLPVEPRVLPVAEPSDA
jgi:hypothetical protein